MRLYLNYFLMELKSQMQYKTSFFLTMFGQFLTSFTTFFGIRFLFDRIYGIDDFTYGQVLLCFSVVMMSFSLGEMAGGGLAVFPDLLRGGELDRILVRPRSILLQVIMPNMDFSRLGLLAQAMIVLGAAVPASGVVWTLPNVLVLVLMVLCGSVVFFCLFLLFATAAFFTVQSLNFLDIFTYGMRDFGRYPLSVYGEGVLRFLTFVIPLALIQYYPLLYLLGRKDNALYALAPLFALLFVIPSVLFYRAGLRNYKSTGS
ncbi:MAG: hypothetical protein HFI35_10405 [Roseburia sp.]|jgi:ABC-2 type transport system permease protein|nr:hypothetical protein [Roseburia sp.]